MTMAKVFPALAFAWVTACSQRPVEPQRVADVRALANAHPNVARLIAVLDSMHVSHSAVDSTTHTLRAMVGWDPQRGAMRTSTQFIFFVDSGFAVTRFREERIVTGP